MERSLIPPGWPFPGQDLNKWRYAPGDIAPPLQVAWRWESPGRIPPVEVTGDGDRAYVALLGGKTVCLNADGSQRWISKATRLRKGSLPLHSPYLVDTGIVVVHEGGVECLDRKDGSTLWSVVDGCGYDILDRKNRLHRLLGGDRDFSKGLAWCRDNGDLVFISESGAVRIVDPQNGHLKHVTTTWAGPVSYGGGLFLGSIRQAPGETVPVKLMDLSECEAVVVPDFGRELMVGNTICRVSDRLLIPSRSFLVCVGIPDGRLIWLVDYERQFPEFPYDNAMTLASDGECVYSLHDNRRIVAYQISTGAIAWVSPAPVEHFAWEPFVVSMGHIYTVNSLSQIVVLNRLTGRVLWTMPRINSKLVPNRLSVPNSLLCVSDDRGVTCIKGM